MTVSPLRHLLKALNRLRRPASPPPVVTVVLGDLVVQDVDAVVNAADQTLLGGTGVDGALRAAAGPELDAACRALRGCGIGQAKITPGFRLRARHVVHTVAPVWQPGEAIERANAEALACCYEAAIRLADRQGLTSIAFPALGAGAFGWPHADAAAAAAVGVRRAAARTRSLREIRLVAFERASLAAYERLFGVIGQVEADPARLRYHPGQAWSPSADD